MRNPSSLSIRLSPQQAGAATTALVYRADHPRGAALVLGHGAGAGQNSAFIVNFAEALSALGLDVVTFNFPYIEQRRRIPDRAPVLEGCFRSVIDAVAREIASGAARLFIGGKSMGGRIATQVAAADRDRRLEGLVLLGYPLHPPGRPGERRDKHLGSIGRPMLFVQGSRDAFGTPAELAPALNGLDPPSTLHVVDGGDHSFKLARGDRSAQADVYAGVQRVIAGWVLSGRPPG